MSETDGPHTGPVTGRDLNRDRRAFDALVREYRPRLVSFIRKVVHDPDAAEDVVQRALISAYRHAADFRGDASFWSWLCAIAWREALHEKDAVNRRLEREQPMMEDEPPSVATQDLQEIVVRREDWERILSAIAELPDVEREVLERHDLQGFNHREIGDALGMPEGTVRRRLFNARRRLRSRLTQ